MTDPINPTQENPTENGGSSSPGVLTAEEHLEMLNVVRNHTLVLTELAQKLQVEAAARADGDAADASARSAMGQDIANAMGQEIRDRVAADAAEAVVRSGVIAGAISGVVDGAMDGHNTLRKLSLAVLELSNIVSNTIDSSDLDLDQLSEMAAAITSAVQGVESVSTELTELSEAVDAGFSTLNESVDAELSSLSDLFKSGGISVDGLLLTVPELSVDDFHAAEQTIALHSDGVWWLGFDLFSRELICLPRVGHRGWVVVARCEVVDGAVSKLSAIDPVLPTCRIPRTVEKIASGQGVNVVVMGSSLAEGSGTSHWAGMLFNAASNSDHYLVPGVSLFSNLAVGGAPNQYSLAQLGTAHQHGARVFNESGFSSLIRPAPPVPRGQSELLAAADLLIVTVLANGGEYRLECIEPIVREARKLGIEVLLTADNGHGYPFASAEIAKSAGLYVDGSAVLRVADHYSAEFADTAAYVLDSVFRFPSVDIYRDTIHMATALPAGRIGSPSGGYEVWARAIRSVIPVDILPSLEMIIEPDFSVGLGDWHAHGPARTDVSVSAGRLVCEKNSDVIGQWGVRAPIPAVLNGDEIRVSGVRRALGGYTGRTTQIGLQGGGAGWGSVIFSTPAADGVFSGTVVATRDILSGGALLFFGAHDAALTGDGFTLEAIEIVVESSALPAGGRTLSQIQESQALPISRSVTDFRTPGMAFITLPDQERGVVDSSPTAGSLAASVFGGSSFAARLYPTHSAPDQEMLVLGAGKKAAHAVDGAVGFAFVWAQQATDGPISLDIKANGSVIKTMQLTPSLTRETYVPVLTPSALAKSNGSPANHTIEIEVTSGALKISALVGLTSELEYIPYEELKYSDWDGPQLSDGITGMSTVVSGAEARYRHPNPADRVWWALSSNANGGAVRIYGDSHAIDKNTAGVNHARVYGGLKGRHHSLKNLTDLGSAGSTADGYSAHIAGLIVVHDR